MSNEVRKYSVDCGGTRHTLDGTTFHIKDDHLYVMHGTSTQALFAAGTWLSIKDVSPETNEITITFAEGMTVDDAMKAIERLNERRTNTILGAR